MASKPQRRRRSLYDWEKTEARIVFGNSLNLERVRIREGISWPDTINVIGRKLKKQAPPGPKDHNAITLGFGCNFPVNLPEMNLSPGHPDEYLIGWLIHELTHCWQHQHIGPTYIFRALSVQFRLKDAAYDYGGPKNLAKVRSEGGSIYSFNLEAQGDIARGYYLRQRNNLDVTAYEPYIADIRNAG